MDSCLFKNKYRIKSARWNGWNYSQNGLYFVTICTKNKEIFFGNIIKERMVLSDIGRIVVNFWFKITEYFEFVVLDEFVVMPNHIHGIIIINDNHRSVETRHGVDVGVETHHGVDVGVETRHGVDVDVETRHGVDVGVETRHGVDVGVETRHGASLRGFGPLQKNSLSSIINHFKGAVTKNVNKNFSTNNIGFAWQPRFHDHVIRNEKELYNIRQYILNNPIKWGMDRNNFKNNKFK